MLSRSHSSFTIARCNLETTLQNYRIVLTGHSLGAGVASVLAVLFKDKHPDVSKDLIAYTFSTPGAVFRYVIVLFSITILYCIAGNFQGRKFHEFCGFGTICESFLRKF